MSHRLYPQREREPAHRAYRILGYTPPEDRNQSAHHAGHDAREQVQSSKFGIRKRELLLFAIEDTELQDDGEDCEGKGVEAKKEERGPAIFVPPECAREAREDEEEAEDGESTVNVGSEVWARGNSWGRR
jgi:hypothetical protein